MAVSSGLGALQQVTHRLDFTGDLHGVLVRRERPVARRDLLDRAQGSADRRHFGVRESYACLGIHQQASLLVGQGKPNCDLETSRPSRNCADITPRPSRPRQV